MSEKDDTVILDELDYEPPTEESRGKNVNAVISLSVLIIGSVIPL